MAEQPLSLDPQQLDNLRQRHFGRLLLRAYRAFSLRALEKLRIRGYTGLALAHTMLLTNLDPAGTRITLLAERVGVTRQASGHLVQELEQRGYITRTVDPADRRATIVKLTEEGWRLLQDVVAVKLEIEREYSAILGAQQMQLLREELTKLLDQVEAGLPVVDAADAA